MMIHHDITMMSRDPMDWCQSNIYLTLTRFPYFPSVILRQTFGGHASTL